MEVIEKAVHAHFEFLQANPLPESEAPKPATTNGLHSTEPPRPRPPVLETPFARVNSVVADSPADEAGLKAGDLIRNFGYVNRENHDRLRRVAECVQGNEGVSSIFLFSSAFLTTAPYTLELNVAASMNSLRDIFSGRLFHKASHLISKLTCVAKHSGKSFKRFWCRDTRIEPNFGST